MQHKEQHKTTQVRTELHRVNKKHETWNQIDMYQITLKNVLL